VSKAVGFTATVITRKYAVKIFAILEYHGHGPVLKAGTIGKRQDDDISAKSRYIKLVRELDGSLNANIFCIVDSSRYQYCRAFLFSA
jgi:hypothetical protein